MITGTQANLPRLGTRAILGELERPTLLLGRRASHDAVRKLDNQSAALLVTVNVLDPAHIIGRIGFKER